MAAVAVLVGSKPLFAMSVAVKNATPKMCWEG